MLRRRELRNRCLVTVPELAITSCFILPRLLQVSLIAKRVIVVLLMDMTGLIGTSESAVFSVHG